MLALQFLHGKVSQGLGIPVKKIATNLSSEGYFTSGYQAGQCDVDKGGARKADRFWNVQEGAIVFFF